MLELFVRTQLKVEHWCSLPLTTKPHLSQHFDSQTNRNVWMILRDGTCECNASQNLFKDTSSWEHTIPNSVNFCVSTGSLSNHCHLFNLVMSWGNPEVNWNMKIFWLNPSLHIHFPSAASFPHHTLVSQLYVHIKQWSRHNLEQNRPDLSWFSVNTAWPSWPYHNKMFQSIPDLSTSHLHIPASVSHFH